MATPPTRASKAAPRSAPAATRKTAGGSAPAGASKAAAPRIPAASSNAAAQRAPAKLGRPAGRPAEARQAVLQPPSEAVEQAVAANSKEVTLPLVGKVELPPVEHLLFYAAIGGLALVELVEWPVALLIGVGKVLADNRSHATLRSVGDALEEAG